MAKRKVMLKYPEQLIKEPVLFRMAKEFDVMPNIRRARVTETIGEIVADIGHLAPIYFRIRQNLLENRYLFDVPLVYISEFCLLGSFDSRR